MQSIFKLIAIVLFFLCGNVSFSQLKEGFEPNEAKALIALCNSFSFLDVYGSDAMIIPQGYTKVFTSEVIGLDNMFQIYEYDKVGVINFRGSTSKPSSWIENMYSAMIPAEGIVKIENTDRYYKFASDTVAAIHTGYALAVILLSPSLIEQINVLNAKGIYNIYITGHSQGGALSLLTRSFLENLPDGEISAKNVFKTYTFGNPMCGNEQFAKEYESRFSINNTSYSIINPDDMVPTLPVHIGSNVKFPDESGLARLVYAAAGVEKPILREFTQNVFGSSLVSMNQRIENIIVKYFITIDVDDYKNDVDYYQIGRIIKLEPFPNPKIPVDTTGMNAEDKANLIQGENGIFYEQTGTSFQHQPYQYYRAILRKYFHEEYEKLELIYLPDR